MKDEYDFPELCSRTSHHVMIIIHSNLSLQTRPSYRDFTIVCLCVCVVMYISYYTTQGSLFMYSQVATCRIHVKAKRLEMLECEKGFKFYVHFDKTFSMSEEKRTEREKREKYVADKSFYLFET